MQCWGGAPLNYEPGTVPDDLPPAVEVVAGNRFTCVLLADGSVRCWGTESSGVNDVPADLPPLRLP